MMSQQISLMLKLPDSFLLPASFPSKEGKGSATPD